MSFAHQTAARQSRSKVGESFAISASILADQESSAMLAAAASIHEPQQSRSCRIDTRQVSHCHEEDAKSANHCSRKSDSEVEKKNKVTLKSETF